MNAQRSRPRHLRAVPQPEQGSEEAAVLAAWESDGPEFGALFYDHLIGVIDRTLCRVLGQRTVEHDDLVQHVFEQILVTLAEGKYQRACSLRTWASAIASRVGLNTIRSRKTHRKYFADQVPLPERPAPQSSPQDAVDQRRTLELVRQTLAQLSPSRAEALVLHDFLGHDLVEVAALTGVTVAAAQSRLVRGRKELQRRLEKQGIRAGADDEH